MPPWFFALLNNSGNAALISVPFVLRRAGVSVPQIAELSALLGWATTLFFLWSPMIDVFFPRRTWIVILSAGGALLGITAFAQPLPGNLARFTAWVMMHMVVVAPVTAAAGGIASELTPAGSRGSMGGWLQAGNLGVSSIGAALVIFVAGRISIPAAGWALGLVTSTPAWVALLLPKTSRVRPHLREEFARLWRNLRAGFSHTHIREGVIIFLTPVGASALTYLFSGLAADYRAGEGLIAFSNGPGGGLLTMGGAIVGGVVAQRFGTRFAYAGLGIGSALAALLMLASPIVPMTYAIGSLAYNAVGGCCYAAFSALALELIDLDTEAAGTWYAAFCSIANVPIMYSEWLDGVGYARGGPRGMLGMDAALGGLSSVLMLAWFLRRRT